MSETSDYLQRFCFGVYPYICLTVFFLGSWLRFDREQYTWRSGSSEMLRKRQLVIGSNVFHVAALLLVAGHMGGMLTPPGVLAAAGLTPERHAIAEVFVGGGAGVLCFIGTTILLHRRLFDRRIWLASTWSDVCILVLIWVQLLVGLGTVPFSWEDHLTGDTLLHAAAWAQHLATFRADAWQLLLPIPFVYKLHCVLGLTVILLVPFTRLVHIWSAPIWYLGRRYQIVREPFRRAA
jgi:nitrate reductase gamma subunit